MRAAGRLCKAPRTQSMAMQRKGTLIKAKARVPDHVVAAAAAATGDIIEPALPTSVKGEAQV